MIRRALRWCKWAIFDSPGDLLRDELSVEIVIHILPDFTRKVYVSKFTAPNPAFIAKVVESVVRTGMDIGQQHGIQIQFMPQNGPQPEIINAPTHA